LKLYRQINLREKVLLVSTAMFFFFYYRSNKLIKSGIANNARAASSKGQSIESTGSSVILRERVESRGARITPRKTRALRRSSD
jgi:hypothetical protein